MRLIFSVTFAIILGNTYSSTSTTSTDPQTTSSSVSSQTPLITTRDGATSETSEIVTTETGTTETETTETGITESTTTSASSTTPSTTSSDTMTSTNTESTTTLSDSSTNISTTLSVTLSETTTSTSPTSLESTTNISSVLPHTSDSTTVSETSETVSSSTEKASISSGASTTVTETSFSATSSSSYSTTPTTIHSSGTSFSSDSTSSSSTFVPTTTISTTSERITTNMTTEGLTTEETSESSTTEGLTSTSSTTLPQTITTPTSHQTIPVYNINEEYTLYAGDSITNSITLSINVTFEDCLRGNQVLANIIDEILKLDTCKSVATESTEGCGNNTSYFVIFRVDVLASSLIDDEEIKKETIENITTTINSTSAGSVLSAEALFYSSLSACKTDICQEAVSNNKGFSCESNGSNCTLSSPCSYDNGNCSESGTCFVQTNGTGYIAICKCKEDDMHTYSGSKCESKAYSWKLWTIVASGVGGGIIVILLFAVVIQCARKKSESFNQKYGYDSGFDDRENLMYDRRYVTSDEYHRKPVPRDDVGADQVNLQSFENKGYDHWEPAESKETYASMDRHFQDPTFNAQITRPKLTTNKYSGDQLTPF